MTNNSLETDVALLKSDFSQVGALFAKLDSAIDKISTATTEISRILAVQTEKIASQEKMDRELADLIEIRRKEMSEDIKELNVRLSNTQRELADDISSTESKIVELLNELKLSISANSRENDQRIEKLQTRIETLERWRWMLVGAGIVAGAVASKVLSTFSIAIS